MKFGDKLVELRKKNGYSQEELAEKLGVSRQSVSKWESNNTYPETDKIIQIANLFECSMDDLINDKITDIEGSLRKNKNIYNVWDSLLEFIAKTINMFSKMTFLQGFKCIIEMVIVGLLLALLGTIICGTASSVIANIFKFLNNSHVLLIREILNSIFHLVWFILTIIVIIYTFKIRYLNEYEKETIKINDKKNTDNKNESIDNKIIRNENEKPFAFLGILSKIVIVFIKVFLLINLLWFLFPTIGFIVADVILIFHIPTNIMFLWLLFMSLSSSVIAIQLIILIICFIFNKKFNFKYNLIVFVASLVLFGLGLGLSIISFKNIEFIDDNSIFNLEKKEINLEYKDNLVVESAGVGVTRKYKYIIDNEIEDNNIVVSREVDSKYFNFYEYDSTMDKMPVIKITQESHGDFKLFYNLFIENLKDNKIYTFDEYGNDPLIIRANEDTLNKLINNLKVLYLIEEKSNGNEIEITIHQDRVFFKNGLNGEYDGVNDSIKYDVEDYSCKREIESTEYGERIIYSCDYNNKDN